VDDEAEAFVARELVEFFPKEEAIRAEVHPAALLNEAADNFGNLGVQKGLPSGD
jgi:hypothetical protein